MSGFESLVAATIAHRSPEIKKQLDTSHALGAWLQEKKSVKPWTEGGETIETIVSMALNDSMAARDPHEAIPMGEQNPLRTLSLPRKFVNGSLMWYESDEEANTSKAKVVDFVNTIIDNARDSLANAKALQYWKDGTGKTMHGLPAMISASNTYMGVDRSVAANSWWRAQVKATSEALAIDTGTDGGIQGLYDACCNNSGVGGPDFAITTLALYNKIKAAVNTGLQRFNERLAQIGFPENLQYHGMTIVWDTNCPSGTFWALNSQFVKERPYGSYANGIKQTPVAVHYSEGIMAKSILLQHCGNLSCDLPRRCGVMTNKS